MLMTPDNFQRDAYGWLTNQIGHLALGFSAVVLYCALGSRITGEFPEKWMILSSISVSYALIEIIQRGGFWDGVEDFVFVVVYGAGLTLWVMDWGGGTTFTGDILDMSPWIYFVIFHLLCGSVVRLARSGK